MILIVCRLIVYTSISLSQVYLTGDIGGTDRKTTGAKNKTVSTDKGIIPRRIGI